MPSANTASGYPYPLSDPGDVDSTESISASCRPTAAQAGGSPNTLSRWGQAMKRTLLLAVSAIVWQAMFAGPGIADETAPSRTILHFPSDRPVGWLAVLDPGTRWQDLTPERIEKCKQVAQGDIRIAADKKVFMLLSNPRGGDSRERPVDLSPLDQFPPDQLVGLTMPFVTITAQEVKRLPRHEGLRYLMFGPLSRVDDAALKPLEEIIWLESFSVPETNVSDAGLQHLQKLTNLRELILYGTKVTDAGLEYLRNMTQLRILDLGMTRIEGPGLKLLAKLNKLERLVLWNTGVDDAALAYLRQFPNLRSLDVKGTAITDAGLQHIAPLTQLERLDLGSTGITDKGLSQLARMRHLKTLLLGYTQLTEDAVRKLRESLPDTTVYYQPLDHETGGRPTTEQH